MLVALIPVIQLLDLTQYTKIIITMSSAIILIIEGILSSLSQPEEENETAE